MKIARSASGIESVSVQIQLDPTLLPDEAKPLDALAQLIAQQVAGALEVVNAPCEVEVSEGVTIGINAPLAWPGISIQVDAEVPVLNSGVVARIEGLVLRGIAMAIEYTLNYEVRSGHKTGQLVTAIMDNPYAVVPLLRQTRQQCADREVQRGVDVLIAAIIHNDL